MKDLVAVTILNETNSIDKTDESNRKYRYIELFLSEISLYIPVYFIQSPGGPPTFFQVVPVDRGAITFRRILDGSI